MKKLRGKLVASLAAVAFFGLLGSAQAQAPAMDAAAPSMMPAPAAAAMGSDNMAGQLGIGVGVTAGTTSLIVPGVAINMKYWLSDVLAVMPQLQLKMYKAKGVDMDWAFSPNALILFCPWKTTSTRLSVGGGLGLEFAKWGAPAAGAMPDLSVAAPGAPGPDTFIAINVPVYAGLEHFFTKWFSMGVALQNNFLQYAKQGTPWSMSVTIDNVNSLQASGFLFFYTD